MSPTPAYDAMAFADIVRSGNEHGLLLHDWVQWKLYREMQSKTSHTYNEGVALEVVAGISLFLAEAQYLMARLEERCAR